MLVTTKKLHSTEDELEQFRERVHTLEIAMQHIINGISLTHCDKIVLWPSHLHLASNMVANTSDKHVTPVILKVSNFTDLKVQKKKWFSIPFYTHRKGYKMCISVYPNGVVKGEGSHMSMFLHVMKGPYDNQFSWPFEIYLLNQIIDTTHYKSEVSFSQREMGDRVFSGVRGKGWGSQVFISNEKLENITLNCQFLKNDTVFLKVWMNSEYCEW